ncbi:unnamed protein product [Ilex paraguariensis]|uniref:Pentatricopeptide repeat-containing protein n=1 Tax=Ilex paraguariensis TaxID=185542 RepID=A0ABC8T7F8_9AQUA
MSSLFPTTVVPCPSKPQQTFPSLKINPLNNTLTSSSCKLLQEIQHPNFSTTQLSVSSKVLTCDQPLILNDWPQHLKFSIGSGNLYLGQSIHGFLMKLGYENNSFQGNNLINLYANFNRVNDAQRVFDEMRYRNTITWTSLINGYSRVNDVESVFKIANDMYRLEEEFNEHTCSVILRACESPDDRIKGQQIHGFVVKSGFCEDVVVGTSLISMYSRSGFLEDAEKVYSEWSYKDVRCLNFLISEYGKVGYLEKAIWVFIDLLSFGLEPTDYTFTNVISACDGAVGVAIGRQLHGLSIKHDLVGETSVGNAIVTMYGKHGLIEEAESMFHRLNERNLVSWTALLSGYVKNGHGELALKRFVKMVDLGIYIDCTCLATVLDGCSECNNLDLGLQFHGFVLKLGFLSHIKVGTALIDLYAKCGNQKCAKLLFDDISIKSTAMFNATLVGFTKVDEADDEDYMTVLGHLRLTGIKPDSVTFAQLLSLTADQACLVKGKSLHAYIVKTGFEADFTVSNAVITMYAKCGSIEDAYHTFFGMNDQDKISWNAMVSAFALHGQGEEALLVFEEMMKEGFVPDEITILAVLQGCNYSGLWDYGFCLFGEMELKYGVKPVLEHFACMVDILGRAGKFVEAIDFISKSRFSDSPLLWRTLVHACKLHGNMHFGKIATQQLLELTPKEAGSYILVSNMFAEGGMLDEAARVRTAMTDLKMSKEAGCSWIEIDKMTHQFWAGSKEKKKSRDVYAILDILTAEMKQISGDITNL